MNPRRKKALSHSATDYKPDHVGIHQAFVRDRRSEAIDVAIARVNAELDREAQHGKTKIFTAEEIAAYVAAKG